MALYYDTQTDPVEVKNIVINRPLSELYTQLEYLESSGTQYINTGVVLKSEATITTVGQSLQSVATGPNSFWGFMGGMSNLPRWGWSIYSNRWLPDLNTTSQSSGTADTNKHTFINTCYYENNVLKYDSLLDGNSVSGGTVENPTTYTSNTLSAYLFARNNSGTVGNLLSCRIFSYEIVQDGIKVLSLIPCRRNSDNVLGMYDMVTGNFLTNSGTGTFVAGDDAVPSQSIPTETNYVIRNNKLVWAKPNMYLTGPVNYTVVGSPTIVDNVVSGFSSSNYIQTSQSNTSFETAEVYMKFKLGSAAQIRGIGLLYFTKSLQLYNNNSGVNSSWNLNIPGLSSAGTKNFLADTEYVIKVVFGATEANVYYLSNGAWVLDYTFSFSESSLGTVYLGHTSSRYLHGTLDLNNTYIKVNDQLWFYGKNYTTSKLAPVPSGYTYGSSITPAVGWVDMETQQFIAAPTGATIGRDE